jgi:hypothetical protein
VEPGDVPPLFFFFGCWRFDLSSLWERENKGGKNQPLLYRGKEIWTREIGFCLYRKGGGGRHTADAPKCLCTILFIGGDPYFLSRGGLMPFDLRFAFVCLFWFNTNDLMIIILLLCRFEWETLKNWFQFEIPPFIKSPPPRRGTEGLPNGWRLVCVCVYVADKQRKKKMMIYLNNLFFFPNRSIHWLSISASPL